MLFELLGCLRLRMFKVLMHFESFLKSKGSKVYLMKIWTSKILEVDCTKECATVTSYMFYCVNTFCLGSISFPVVNTCWKRLWVVWSNNKLSPTIVCSEAIIDFLLMGEREASIGGVKLALHVVRKRGKPNSHEEFQVLYGLRDSISFQFSCEQFPAFILLLYWVFGCFI